VADDGPSGHSIFTWILLQGLSGLADLDGNGVLTATELGAFTAPIVSKFSSQTPAFGNLEGSEGGEFVFPIELENLSQMSQALDREAVAVSAELENLQRELTSKLERNLELQKRVEELRSPGAVEPSHEERLAQANRHHALGLQYFREERHELALGELEEAVRLNPGNPTIVNNYGFVLYRLGRYQESLEWFEKTLALEPDRAVAHLNLADALWKLGREEEARPRYRRYLELWPSTPRRSEIEQLIGDTSR
jgi:tetratricopeptide (TPR) repeat protein